MSNGVILDGMMIWCLTPYLVSSCGREDSSFTRLQYEMIHSTAVSISAVVHYDRMRWSTRVTNGWPILRVMGYWYQSISSRMMRSELSWRRVTFLIKTHLITICLHNLLTDEKTQPTTDMMLAVLVENELIWCDWLNRLNNNYDRYQSLSS